MAVVEGPSAYGIPYKILDAPYRKIVVVYVQAPNLEPPRSTHSNSNNPLNPFSLVPTLLLSFFGGSTFL